MFCKFVESTGDFMMFDSGLVDAEPVRMATHEEISVLYLHWYMFHYPGWDWGLADWYHDQAHPEGEQTELL